ncbi:Hint domain-containing protein [Pseudomonas sp. Irchel 3E13]|uniref:Hint domain-containing protein n=1 Tax=Pseudomonas sp. Irchel 3E13 TaxID=2008975 RepID=UPI000BA39AC7|nr:Hint domain-containing protein [Pseudomonas sp. Irchel 3E13]
MATRDVVRAVRHALFTLAAVLAPIGLASAQAYTDKAPPPLSSEVKADLKALDAELKPGIPHRLNLANPLHYRVALETLKRAGKTPERSPHLFKTLAAGHEAGVAALKKSGGQPAKAVALSDEVSEGPENLNFIATFSQDNTAPQSKALTDSQPGYQATGISSVVDGTVSTTIIMELFEVETGNVYANVSKSQYGEGTDFRLDVQGQVPSADGNPTTKAQAMFYYFPKNAAPNDPPVMLIQSYQDTVNPTAACMNQPNYCVRDNNGNCTGSYQTTCTNTKDNTQQIKLCWARGSQQECDYWNSTAHPTDFVFPLSGSATFANTPLNPATGVITISIQNPTGGGCQVYYQQGSVLESQYWSTSAQTVTWNYPATAFPNTGNCINYYDGTAAYLWVTGYVALNGAPGQQPPFGTLNFNSDRANIGQPGVNIIPPLYIMQGCLAEGTPITLADGSQRAVEAFTGKGDETVKSADGKTSQVFGTTKGGEIHPMIRVKTNGGQNVLVTRTHPMILANGMPVQARSLRVGDVLLTVDGSAAVTSLTQENYTGKVHNLLTQRYPNPGTYYAGGLLTGDANMQQSLASVQSRVPMRSPAEIRASLPKEWLQDFDNDQ